MRHLRSNIDRAFSWYVHSSFHLPTRMMPQTLCSIPLNTHVDLMKSKFLTARPLQCRSVISQVDPPLTALCSDTSERVHCQWQRSLSDRLGYGSLCDAECPPAHRYATPGVPLPACIVSTTRGGSTSLLLPFADEQLLFRCVLSETRSLTIQPITLEN